MELLQTSLFELLSDVGKLMQHRASEKGISFGYEYKFPLPTLIDTDPLRLKQILINLIGNAIKFTERGGVKVVISALHHYQNLSFAIVDTGIGLSKKRQQKLLQAFSQAHTSTTREFGGSGLGLVISNELAHTLGGEITIDSAADIGSTFTLSIYAGQSSFETLTDSAPATIGPAPLEINAAINFKGKILLAEDAPTNQQYLSYALNKAKVDFQIVENGALAVEAVKSAHFDLILMDMQMPVMDGYTATQMLRQSGYTLPIVALTANIMKQDIERCMAAGCTDFLGKPFDVSAFYKMLSTYLQISNSSLQEISSILPSVKDPGYIPLILDFIAKLPERVLEIENAHSQKNRAQVSMLSHRLRGAAMFGYEQLGIAAGNVEDAIANNRDSELLDLLNTLKLVCDRICKGKDELVSLQ